MRSGLAEDAEGFRGNQWAVISDQWSVVGGQSQEGKVAPGSPNASTFTLSL